MHPQDQRSQEAEEAIASLNAKTGRNMPQAIATAVVLIAVIVACLLISVDVFVALIIVFMMLALWELRVDFATVGLHIPVMVLWIGSVATIGATYLLPHHIVAMACGAMATMIAVSIAASLHVRFGNRLSMAVATKLSTTDVQTRNCSSFGYDAEAPHHSRLSHVAVSLFTVLYITVLGSCLVIPLTAAHPVSHALTLVFLPALSDTGGLFAGAWFGKHKLSPRISPKKSVEGLLGSMLFAMIGAYVIFACTYDTSLWVTRWWTPAVMGVMIGVVGTFGDLCASMLKRDIGLKDMGHLLKGHGGVLDRVDSIVLCAPFVTVLLWATGL